MSKSAEQGERIPLPRTDLEENEVVLEEPAEDSAPTELGSSLENF
jgi:hypothetical protein